MSKSLLFGLGCIIVLALSLYSCMRVSSFHLPVQDAAYYLPKNTLLVSPLKQTENVKNFLIHYYSPWTGINQVMTTEKVIAAENTLAQQFLLHPGVGEDKRPHSPSWMQVIVANMNLTARNKSIMAITIDNTNERLLPSDEPVFKKWDDVNFDGYPFDRLQVSFLNANTPVQIIHTTQDGAWDLILVAGSIGWVHSNALALVNSNFIHQWQQYHYIIFTKDQSSISDVHQQFRFYGRIGALLPFIKLKNKKITVLIAVADQNQQAKIIEATVDDDDAAPWPILFTSTNLAKAINQLLDQPYGWGGLYGFRDCSLTTADLYAQFGIWLPRNSEDQAHRGLFFDMTNLSAKLNQQLIKEKAIPGLTLLGFPGHVTVFLAINNDYATVFQSTWTIHSNDHIFPYGRSVISKIKIRHFPGMFLTNLTD